MQRSDENFKTFVDSAICLANELEIDPSFPIPKPRKKVRLFNYEGNDEPISNSYQKFKAEFYFTILDHATSSVQERFTLLAEC